ncbi:MAG: riboflavin synthase, partial [Bdellovibrionaceae bacterium]|nr:riboflavin synthase [Pseudobdellovibrionaceae bacterium]
MFSGIIETTAPITAALERAGVLQCTIARPANFDDIKHGDSIAVDGVCLTLEAFDLNSLTFALGPETLRVTGWTLQNVLDRVVNLERSLRLNDRIHGHLVTGHVDALGTVQALDREGETLRLTIGIPQTIAPYIWPKGSVAI